MIPRIAITMGDPAGIGPEICLRLLGDARLAGTCVPLVYGDASVLQAVANRCQLALPSAILPHSQLATCCQQLDQPAVIDLQAIQADQVTAGRADANSGRAAYHYIQHAIQDALQGHVQGITTGPIHKEALHAAGISYPGHTEIFADETKTERYCMMLTSELITCSLVTTHIGLHEVPDALTETRILDVIRLSDEAMRRLRGRPPRLVVCGLNPHAGEHGLFGRGEEEQVILPAIRAARDLGLDVSGPLSPDTAFLPSRRDVTDCYVCMYHDQGLIPLKALAFDQAVNVTLGLPIVRTSVDHGTALDIAWQGVADPSSLYYATMLAAQLAAPPHEK